MSHDNLPGNILHVIEPAGRAEDGTIRSPVSQKSIQKLDDAGIYVPGPSADGTAGTGDQQAAQKALEFDIPELVQLVNQHWRALAEGFAISSKGICHILEEEPAIVNAYLDGKPRALHHYLAGHRQALANYLVSKPHQFNQLLDNHPEVLALFEQKYLKSQKQQQLGVAKKNGKQTETENDSDKIDKRGESVDKEVEADKEQSEAQADGSDEEDEDSGESEDDEDEEESEQSIISPFVRRNCGYKRVPDGKVLITRVTEGGKTVPMLVDEGSAEAQEFHQTSAMQNDGNKTKTKATPDDAAEDSDYEEDGDDSSDSDDDEKEEDQDESEADSDAPLASLPRRATVPYPAKKADLDASRKLKHTKTWRLYEEDLAIKHMLDVRDENEVFGEFRFMEVATRLFEIDGVDRSWAAVKNFWNRAGRARSGFDERKNKRAPLATSQQGKGIDAVRQRAQAARDAERNSQASSQSVAPDIATPPDAADADKNPAKTQNPVQTRYERRTLAAQQPNSSIRVNRSSGKASRKLNQGQEQAKKSPRKAEQEKKEHRESSKQARQKPKVSSKNTSQDSKESHESENVKALQEEIKQMQSEQSQIQAQMQAQLQAQMAMFNSTLAAITSNLTQQAPQQPQTASAHQAAAHNDNKKRGRYEEDANDYEDSELSDSPSVKKQKLDPDEKSRRKWPVGRRDTPPAYDRNSRQETQPGDRTRAERETIRRRDKFGSATKDIRRDPSNRAWQNGTRDRSGHPKPRYH